MGPGLPPGRPRARAPVDLPQTVPLTLRLRRLPGARPAASAWRLAAKTSFAWFPWSPALALPLRWQSWTAGQSLPGPLATRSRGRSRSVRTPPSCAASREDRTATSCRPGSGGCGPRRALCWRPPAPPPRPLRAAATSARRPRQCARLPGNCCLTRLKLYTLASATAAACSVATTWASARRLQRWRLPSSTGRSGPCSSCARRRCGISGAARSSTGWGTS
mmetsp:Transcript_88658/g.280570  ORF Transcript_88658/g.280570 Transcript_88658/m.280570 type:complete len:220 (-) Transcript_88658:892-1551(-)